MNGSILAARPLPNSHRLKCVISVGGSLLEVTLQIEAVRHIFWTPPHTRQLILEPDKMPHSCFHHPCWIPCCVFCSAARRRGTDWSANKVQHSKHGQDMKVFQGLLTVDLPMAVKVAMQNPTHFPDEYFIVVLLWLTMTMIDIWLTFYLARSGDVRIGCDMP